MDDDNTEADDSEDESSNDERVTLDPTFMMDDVHAQAVSELRAANVDVESVIAQRLHQSVEQCIYEFRQLMKYDSGEQ